MARAARTTARKAPAKPKARAKTSATDSLAAYHAKRDFAATQEPRGKPARGKKNNALSFCVQHHWATRDHYDFRLELDGTLKSWAVTRGPSTDPIDKRLAVRTEDHPLDYGDFEGTIPKGQYGGGTVMLWDRGTWTPLTDDPQAEFAKGKIAFNLDGARMKGRWALVRMKPRSAADAKRENWLLIKEKDEHVAPLGRWLDDATTSVSTGRTKAEIENGKSRVWQSDRTRSDKKPVVAKPTAKARRGAPPDFIKPMLCATQAPPPPEGEAWRYEIKYDGYRLQACVDGATVHLYTREGLDWTKRFPTIARGLAALDLPRCALDGEAVVFDARGISDFTKLVASLENDKADIAFVAFDLLSVGRKDLRTRPLRERRLALEEVLAGADGDSVRIAPTMDGDGKAVFEAAIAGGAEGIIAKKSDSPYQSRRTPNWLKVKGETRVDAIVVGYMPSTKRPFASLALAMKDGSGLRFAGGAGSGFSQAELARTKKKLDALRADAPPPGMTNRQLAQRKMVWVQPQLQAELQITGFTGDGQLRHARFLGWKEDRKGGAPKRDAPAKVPVVAETPTTAALAEGRLTNPDRVLIPQAKITKQVLADYLAAVADRMLPHLRERPVSFLRAPDGIEKERFFQRHALPGMKTGLGKVPDPGRGHGDYLQILSSEGLRTCAQFSVVELHGWGAILPDLKRPDRVVFDLDPDESLGFAETRRAAIEIRDLLDAVGLKSWPLLSGGKGIHVIAPLDQKSDWEVVGGFAEGVARGLAKAAPDRFVAVASKEKRKDRIFVDYLRNKQSASAIVPWSPRARASGTAAVPVTWKQLAKIRSADQFTLAAAAKREDPWAGEFFATRQGIADGVLAAIRKAL